MTLDVFGIHLPERGDGLLGQAVGQVLALGIAAEVLEGQHGEGHASGLAACATPGPGGQTATSSTRRSARAGRAGSHARDGGERRAAASGVGDSRDGAPGTTSTGAMKR